jgi:hypothetical protein
MELPPNIEMGWEMLGEARVLSFGAIETFSIPLEPAR